MKRLVASRGLWLALALIPSLALATPARVGALLGNDLVEDDTDYFRFPSLAARYGRSAFLNVGGFQAGFVHGYNTFVGASYGTPVLYDDLARTSEALGRTLLRPIRLLSFVAAGKLSDGMSLGFALNPAFNITRSFPAVGTTGVITNSLSLDVEVIAGLSMYGGPMVSDTALAVSYHRFQQRSAGVTLNETKGLPSFALRHRSIWVGMFGETADLGLYAELARRDESFTQDEPFTSVAAINRWVAVAGIGPRFRPVAQVLIVPSVELSYVTVLGSVDTARFQSSNTTVPNLRLSVEGAPFSWLFVRAGILRRFSVRTDKPTTGSQTDTTSEGFSWSTGAGLLFGAFQLDATISQALLTNGPSFIGGGSPGLFGSLSLRYTY